MTETPDSTGETTVLTCVKCGLTAPLTDSGKMADTGCGAKQTQQQTKPENVKCVVCRNPATKTAPFWNSNTMAVEVRNVCNGCYSDWLKLLKKGPEISPRVYGRSRGYYFLPLNTWFEEIAGAWPCPACEEFFDSFSEVVNHFADRHPDKAKPLEEVEVDIDGRKVKAYRCWQGVYCPCGYLTDNERHLASHYRREHSDAF
ncbi:MAG: hypothetical protein QW137_08380 [Candidatus Caldarchaeum sp.]